MKLLSVKKRKIAIIFTGGLGDTLLYTPLLNELKKRAFKITAIFVSKTDNDCLFDNSLCDSKFHFKTRIGLIFFALLHFKRFSNCYINHLSKGILIKSAALLCSRCISTSVTSGNNRRSKKRRIPEQTDLTYAEENLHLLYTHNNAKIKNIKSFFLPSPQINKDIIKALLGSLESNYFIVQVSAGNNTTPFKNWPADNWLEVIKKLCNNFKYCSFVITGDQTETAYAANFENLNLPNCRVLIGKTSVAEIFNLIAFGKGYIGLDSGLMHMATALQKKTLSIFGASDEKLLGYSFLDAENHVVIAELLPCRPCSSWKNPNTSRVTTPLRCPDFACLTNIKVNDVYNEIVQHFSLK